MEKGDVEGAKTICRNTLVVLLLHLLSGFDENRRRFDVVERSVVSRWFQAGYLEKDVLGLHIVHRYGSVFGILGYCNRYGYGVRPNPAGW